MFPAAGPSEAPLPAKPDGTPERLPWSAAVSQRLAPLPSRPQDLPRARPGQTTALDAPPPDKGRLGKKTPTTANAPAQPCIHRE